MQRLLPIQSTDSDFLLKGDLTRAGCDLTLTFEIIDSKSFLQLPKPFLVLGADASRRDGLWNDTCFEMFMKPENNEAYYEFNFSLSPAWNEYYFQKYRDPQPPKPCQDILLKQMQWDGKKFQIELILENSKINFDIGLTAILKEKSGAKHYLAIAHAGEKPDFHLAKSFILKR